LATVLLATNMTLWITKHASPFDGEKKVSGADVWWSVLAVATAGLGPLTASLGKAATTSAQLLQTSTKLEHLRSAASLLRTARYLKYTEMGITSIGLVGDANSGVEEVEDIQATLDGQPHPYQIVLWPFRNTPAESPSAVPRTYETSWLCDDLLRLPDPWDRSIVTGQCRLAPVSLAEVLR
jgi:hypothetical protein